MARLYATDIVSRPRVWHCRSVRRAALLVRKGERSVTIHTRLTEILGIEHPVMLAGMGGVSYHQLVAAVSEAGGFGCLGASTMPGDVMVDEIRAAKALTDKPFGV